MKSKNRQSGFTLLEILLALALFTIIGIATAKHLQQLSSTKNAAFRDMEIYNSLRTAVSILRFDLNQAFHVGYEDLGDETKQLLLQGQSAPHTLFDGRKKELIFTSLSHRLYYLGRKETEQTELSYFLQDQKGQEFPSLMKRESTFIDDKLYEGGALYTIIENVFSLSFQYWDDKKNRWVEDWSSDQGEFRDKFPLAVKMDLEVIGRGEKKIKISTEFKLANPNNKEFLATF